MRTVYFDVETGGLDPALHQITQLGAVVVNERWDVLEEFEVKIQLETGRWTQEALDRSSYDPEVWAREAVPELKARSGFDVVLRKYSDVAKISKAGKPYSVARLAAQNAPFDTSFLGELYRRGSMFCPAALYEPLDTLPLARWYTSAHPSPPVNHKLETLAEWLGLPAFEAHDALADVRATVAVARELCKRLGIGATP